jgi:2,3-dihydroxyphenylpropionate 1,2-dioxygenase
MSAQFLAVCASHSPLLENVDAGDAGVKFFSAIEDAKATIAAFDPELVVFFGPDHFRALQGIVPPVTIATSATGFGDWGTPEDPYVVPAELANQLSAHLLSHEFDVAVGSEVRIDHGFGQTFMQLFSALDAIPVIPIVLNCASMPRTSVSRVIDLAQAVGEFMAATNKRVLFLGSGGLSHQPPSMSAEVRALPSEEREAIARKSVLDAAKYVNAHWDSTFLESLTTCNWSALREYKDPELAEVGSGTHEIRTWVAAWAAAGAVAGRFTYVPIPEWITGMGVAVSTVGGSK